MFKLTAACFKCPIDASESEEEEDDEDDEDYEDDRQEGDSEDDEELGEEMAEDDEDNADACKRILFQLSCLIHHALRCAAHAISNGSFQTFFLFCLLGAFKLVSLLAVLCAARVSEENQAPKVKALIQRLNVARHQKRSLLEDLHSGSAADADAVSGGV